VIWTNSSVSGPSNRIRLASTHRLTSPWTLASLREIAVAAQGFCRECEQSSRSLDPAADRAAKRFDSNQASGLSLSAGYAPLVIFGLAVDGWICK
jgi:hypothetical protein